MAGRAQPKSGTEEGKNDHPARGLWWRVPLALLLLLALVAVIFHEKLLRYGAIRVVDRFAASQDLSLDYTLEEDGSLLNRVILRDVHMERKEGSNFPVKTIDADRIALNYNLDSALQQHWAAVLEGLKVDNATVIIRPGKQKPLEEVDPHETRSAADQLAQHLQNIRRFELPVIDLNNLTLSMYNFEGEPVFAIPNIALTMNEDQQGQMHFPKIVLPSGLSLEDVRADLIFRDHQLVLTDFQIPGAATFEKFALDMRKIRDESLGIKAEGEAFEAAVAADFSLAQVDDKLAVDGTVNLQRFNLDQAKDLLGLGKFPRGQVELLDIYLQGNPMAPEELFARIQLEAEELRHEGVNLENVIFRGKLEDGSLTIQHAEASTDDTRIGAIGWARLNHDEWKFTRSEAHILLELDTPEIAQILDPNRYGARGKVDLNARIRFQDSELVSSAVEADLQEFSYRDYNISSAHLELTAVENVITAEQIEVFLTPTNRLTLSGHVGAAEPYPYSLTLDLDFQEIAALRGAVFPEGSEPPLPAAGMLQMQADSTGKIREPASHTASVTLTGEGLQPVSGDGSDDAQPLQVLGSRGDYRVNARAQLVDQHVTIPVLRLGVETEDLVYLKGEFPLRLPPKEEGTDWVPRNEDVTVSLRVVNSPIQDLAGLVGMELPLTGMIEAEADAQGTVRNPRFNLVAAGNDIQFPNVAEIRPAQVLIKAQHDGQQLQLVSSIEQAQVQPMRLELISPVTLEHFTNDNLSLADVSLQAHLALPETSLAFLQEFFPNLELAESLVAAEIVAQGTFGQPSLVGEIAVAAERVGWRDSDIPAIEYPRINLDFDGQVVEISTLSAAVSGGQFSVTGTLDLGTHLLGLGDTAEADAALISPAESGEGDVLAGLDAMSLDLQVTGEELLLYRNNNVILRSNAELQVRGPMATAAVTGQMALTTGRYYQEFNLLPLRLPGGERVSRPPSPGGRPILSLEGTPLENWTFQVDLSTERPFLLQGNLAQGSLVSRNLAFAGKGSDLALTGQAEVQEFTLSLPFSTLRANSGTVIFRPDNLLNPELNVTGHTRVEGREVTVYAYGRISDPQTTFSSSPPMTEEQIVTLLATGATPSQLSGDESAGAERAILFAATELYRKVFGGQPSLNQDLFDGRVSVQSDGVNAATGEDRTTATMEVTDNIQFRTSVETDGTFRGVLQYMIRMND